MVELDCVQVKRRNRVQPESILRIRDVDSGWAPRGKLSVGVQILVTRSRPAVDVARGGDLGRVVASALGALVGDASGPSLELRHDANSTSAIDVASSRASAAL